MNLLVSMIGNQWGVPDTGVVSKKNPVLQFLFNKDVGLRPATLLKKRLQDRCFPVNFEKNLRAPFLQNTSGRLLLLTSMLQYLLQFYVSTSYRNFLALFLIHDPFIISRRRISLTCGFELIWGHLYLQCL